MYKEAIAKKKKSTITGSVTILIFMIVTLLIALKFPMGWILFGFSALFAVLMIVTAVYTNNKLKKMEQEYPGSLELDVDNCDQQVAGKYFFLAGYLADPFNARLIKYTDIVSVKCTETNSRHSSDDVRHEGRTVYLTTSQAQGAMPVIFNDFNGGMAKSDSETVANYEKFIELLKAHVGGDVEITVKQL